MLIATGSSSSMGLLCTTGGAGSRDCPLTFLTIALVVTLGAQARLVLNVGNPAFQVMAGSCNPDTVLYASCTSPYEDLSKYHHSPKSVRCEALPGLLCKVHIRT